MSDVLEEYDSEFSDEAVGGVMLSREDYQTIKATITKLRECVRIGLDYVDSNEMADKFEAALEKTDE